MERLFAVCIPGLEPFVSLELGRLGLKVSHSIVQAEEFFTGKQFPYESGGIEFQASFTTSIEPISISARRAAY